MKPAEKGRQGESTPRLPYTPITASVSSGAAFVFTASISSGAGNGIKEMLRKKFYVVRKKYHVVRKLFYVASIFGGAAGRRNRPPWELFFHGRGSFFHGVGFFFHGIPVNAFAEHPFLGALLNKFA